MTSLGDVRALILASTREDWNVIRSPIYERTVGRVDSSQPSGDTDHWIEIYEHHLLAVYEPDVSIRIAHGINTNDADDWTPDWARFADPQVRAAHADVFWNGALIDRHVVIEVDGGRALLPDPRDERVAKSGDLFDSEVYAHSVRESQVAFARLVHSFTDRDDFDDYFRRASFVVVPD